MTIEDRSIKFYFKDLQVGPKGDPGVSPTISVYDIENGHRVVILDESGAKYFNVLNGISPPYTPNPIGNWLFDQENENLLDLVTDGSFDTDAVVRLDHSRIIQIEADAAELSATRAWFTMSESPRYLGTSIETADFEDGDFKPFTMNPLHNLYCHISGIQTLNGNITGVAANIPACYFYIAFRNDTGDTIYLTLITPTVGVSSGNEPQLIEYLSYIPIMEMIPEGQTVKKIAVAVGLFPGVFNSDVMIDLYLKENEFGLTSSGPDYRYTMAHTNNAMTANRAYEKGDFFIRQNMLFKALQDIAVGDRFVSGVNVVQTNVAEELKGLWESGLVLS